MWGLAARARTCHPSGNSTAPAERPPRRSAGLILALNVVGILLIAGLVGLGVWQVQRRAWKLDLIARVEARIHAEPVSPPGPEVWSVLTPEADAYRRVRLDGVFNHDRSSLVQAVTERGAGFWVLTPLRLEAGFTVLVNRGFVPSARRDPRDRTRPDGHVRVTGLLRVTEPGGGFLRANDPGADRWYSRDVAAIARARGLTEAAPYFVDAEAGPDPGLLPAGGMTVVVFRNDHLVYALTWFALATMSLGALVHLHRETRAARRRPPPGRST